MAYKEKIFSLIDGNGVPMGLVKTVLNLDFIKKCWTVYYNEVKPSEAVELEIRFEAWNLNVDEFTEQMRKHGHEITSIPYIEIEA